MRISKFLISLLLTYLSDRSLSNNFFLVLCISFGLVKSYDMPCNVESASLEPKTGSKFVAGGEDLWVHVFDFFTGEEISKFLSFTSHAA